MDDNRYMSLACYLETVMLGLFDVFIKHIKKKKTVLALLDDWFNKQGERKTSKERERETEERERGREGERER